MLVLMLTMEEQPIASLCLTLLGYGSIIYLTKLSAGVTQLDFSVCRINSQEICLLLDKIPSHSETCSHP